MTGSLSILQNPNVLIFGVTGQDGRYLTRICSKEGLNVYGVSRSFGEWIKGDVADQTFVDDVIRNRQFKYIFHLAADSTTEHEAIYRNHNAIASGAINILEACRRHSPSSRVFLAGSALQFECNGEPVSVSMPFASTSAYVVARNYASFAARYYRTLGLRAYVGYFCHHDSPFRRERHLTTKVALAAKRIGAGSRERLEVEHPEVIREFNFAEDLMEAVWMLVNQEAISECVIGSGKGKSIREWIELCFELSGLHWPDHVEFSPRGAAPFDCLIADSGTIRGIGWEPKVGIRGLAKMMLNSTGEICCES